MLIVEIAPLSNGGHRNQTLNEEIAPPQGWAVVPEGMELDCFPFGEAAAEELDGVMTVTGWTPGAVPELEWESTAQDDADALLIDHEYRLTLLELGVTEEVT